MHAPIELISSAFGSVSSISSLRRSSARRTRCMEMSVTSAGSLRSVAVAGLGGADCEARASFSPGTGAPLIPAIGTARSLSPGFSPFSFSPQVEKRVAEDTSLPSARTPPASFSKEPRPRRTPFHWRAPLSPACSRPRYRGCPRSRKPGSLLFRSRRFRGSRAGPRRRRDRVGVRVPFENVTPIRDSVSR